MMSGLTTKDRVIFIIGKGVEFITSRLSSLKIMELRRKNVKIGIDFEHPYFDEETIFELTTNDLDRFYTDENEVDRLNLFFVLEASLHRLQRENSLKAAARCAFLMSYRIIFSYH